MTEPTHSAGSAKESMLVGIRWVAGARAISEVLQLISSVVLARLIAPPEFGKAIVALVIASIASVLASHAFASLLVQQETIGDDEVRAAVALNVLIGLVLSVAVFSFAEPISALGGEDQAELIRAMSPTCLLAGLSAVPFALLHRRLDFRTVSMIEVAGLLLQIATSLSLAFAGAGAAAIVAGALVARVVSTLGALIVVRPPLPRLQRGAVRRLTSFGAPTALSSLVHTLLQNVDYAIIGARLNATQLAFYFRAFQYGVDYQSKISRILVDMAFPVFSRLGTMDAIRVVQSRIVRVHATVIFPILAGYASLAPTLVPWLLGDRWTPVVVPSQILVIAGAVTTVLTGTGALLLAMGRPGLLLGWNIGHLLCYGTAVYLVAPQGLVAIAATVAGFYVVQGVAAQWFLLRGVAGIPMRDLVDGLLGPCTGCAALIAAAVPARNVLENQGAPELVTLLIAGALGVAAYTLCMRHVFPAAWADLMLLVNRLVRGARTEGAGRAA